MSNKFENIHELADKVRNEYKLNSIPIDLNKITTKLQIKVEEFDFTEHIKKTGREISGLIILNHKKIPNKILINKHDNERRKNFTLAHELGHYFLHNKEIDGGLVSFRSYRSEKEREADVFAAKLLMPDKDVVNKYNSAIFPSVSYLAEIFNVSNQTMRIKLDELRLEYIG